VLVELSVMEQRYQAVLAVLQDGWKVVEVARRPGVFGQSVHNWIASYERDGLVSLADRSHRPASCPHQILAELEALICELRRQHPPGAPGIEHQLARSGRFPAGREQVHRRSLRFDLETLGIPSWNRERSSTKRYADVEDMDGEEARSHRCAQREAHP